MKTKNNSKILMMGLACGLLYTIYPSISNLVPGIPKDTLGMTTFTMTTVVIIFFFSVWFNVFLISPKNYFGIIKKYIKNKDAWKITITNLLGTPIGMGFMAMGIALTGGAIGKSLIALCIPVTAIMERIFLKRKFHFLAMIGILLTTASAISLGLVAGGIEGLSKGFNKEILIGIIFCLIPAFTWAAQGVIMYKIMNKKTIDINPKEITVLKYSFALVFQIIIMLPLMTLINLSAKNTYVALGKMIIDPRTMLILGVIGIVIYGSYYIYIWLTKNVNATVGIVAENLSIIFVPILITIINVTIRSIDSSNNVLHQAGIIKDMESIKTFLFWLFSSTMLIGICLIVIKPTKKISNIFKRRKKDKDWELYDHM